MRTRLIGSLIAFAVASTLAPIDAHAQHGGFKGHSVHMSKVKVAGSVGVHPSRQQLPVRRPPFHGRGFRHFAPFGLGYPVALYPGPDYYDMPAYYPPSGGIPVVNDPGPPPAPDVAEYSGGRYELRGDGISRPYVWVWVPDAPSAPPTTPPRGDVTTRSPSSKGPLPEAKIIIIQPSDASELAPNDPTAPKIITMPRPNTGSSTKR